MPAESVAPSSAARLGFGLASTGLTALAAALTFFQVYFLTDVVLVPAAAVGVLVLVGRGWDLVNDPLLGLTLDRLRDRLSPQRLLRLCGAPLAAAAATLWFVPDTLGAPLRIVWVLGSYFVFDALYTVVSLALNALGAEATQTYDERTRFMAAAAVGAVLGYVLGAGAFEVGMTAMADAGSAFAVTGLLLAVLAGGGVLVAARVLRQRTDVRPTRGSLVDALVLVRGAPVWRLAAAAFCARVGFTLVAAVLPYYAKYHLERERLLSTIILTLTLAVAVTIPLWRRVAERASKAKAYAGSLAVVGGCLCLSWLIPRTSVPITVGFVIAIGVGMAGHWVLPWSMHPDVIDWDEAEVGRRRVGLYFGVFGVFDKLARALAVASIGWLMALAGYVPNGAQPESAHTMIRLLLGPVPAVFVLLAVPLLLRFPLDRAGHEAVRRRLDAARAQATAGERER